MRLLRDLIAGGVRNPVLVNLIMVCMLGGGFLATQRMVREAYPQFSLDHIAVEVRYPGASTADVERAVCTPIEEAVQGITGVREISSSAQENFGIVWVGLQDRVNDPQRIVDEIKERVDRITTFPPQAERPVVREIVIKTDVINVAIHGDAPERTLKHLGQEVRDDLLQRPGISQVALSGVREDEIAIEVSEEALLAYNLSLPQISAIVGKSSLDLPAGAIRTTDEEFTLRVTGQRFSAAAYENLVVLDQGDSVVHLGDIASIREGFEEAVVSGRFNGESAVVVAVSKTPQEDATRIAALVREYVADRQPHLPDRVNLSVWGDGSLDISGRINMLVFNGLQGITLVFFTLWLFLEARVAFWVALGIPVSFAGAMAILYFTGETMNMISLFALIMVSGIIVDDAIVIAESVHERRRAGLTPERSSIEGASAVALPVLASTTTTIAAFIPLLFVVGVMGRFVHVLPVVVIAALTASTVEAFGILPSHLCHRSPPGVPVRPREPRRVRRVLDGAIDGLITRCYRPVYQAALRGRVVTVALAVMALLLSIGMVVGGRTPFVLLPREDGNMLRARVRFPEGTPISVSEETVDRITRASLALNDDPELTPAVPGKLVRQVYSITGEFVDFMVFRGNNLCEIRVELMPAEERRIPDERIISKWRQHVGVIQDATQVTLGRQPVGPLDRPIEIRLLGTDLEAMTEASERIQARLGEFDGLHDIDDDLIPGKRELRINLKPAARALGLTLDDLARQVRFGFYGGEAVRLQRGRDQVAVRVRYPETERRSLTDLENLRITLPRGGVAPFLEVADVDWGRGHAFVMHQDGKRRVRVVADIDESRTNEKLILDALDAGFLSDVVSDYDDMKYQFSGNRARMNESLDSLKGGFVMAVLVIYSIMAAMLRSYIQPAVILITVPMGLTGVVFGHWLLGMEVTIMSFFGAVALAGVVVNDAIVLIDVINEGVRAGKSLRDAVFAAGEMRFRAVILTSVTTIAGMMPILLEHSSQAQSVKPMAVSLCYGLIFATGLTLLLVPAVYLLVNDVRRFFRWLRFGGPYPAPELVEEATRDRLAGVA